jgi:SAM-dependent methyltransferase
MGREWFNEIARRPGGYSIYWDCWVEGQNAQAIFDSKILAARESHLEVLDCGFGDGTFTLEVAMRAKRVVGVDYAENMIEEARKAAEERAVTNVTFIVSHARNENLFPRHSFDFAYTRRGPHIHTVVPEFVRPGGLLAGIHPEETEAQDFARQLREAGLQDITCERFADRFHFPTLEDLAGYLSRQPGNLDLRQPEHRELLMRNADAFSRPSGDYVVQRPNLVWVARLVK